MAQVNHPCIMCGQLDDHPMIQYIGEWTDLKGHKYPAADFHFDCYPPDLLYHLGTPETHPYHANTLATIEAAKSGVRGDDLRAHIAELAEQNNDNIILED